MTSSLRNAQDGRLVSENLIGTGPVVKIARSFFEPPSPTGVAALAWSGLWRASRFKTPWGGAPSAGESEGRGLAAFTDTPPALRGTNYNIFSQSTWTAGDPSPGTNYVPTDKRTIDYFYDKGVRGMRMTFTWEWLQDTLSATIPDTSNAARLQYWNDFLWAVNYATSLGMHVMIEHFGSCDDFWGVGSPSTVPGWKSVGSADSVNYTNQIGGGVVTNAHFANLFSQLATIFKANPRVHFGMCNEPHDISTMQWFGTAQAVITAIRATGSRAWIFVPGNGFSTWEWTNSAYDQAATKRSSAYGWENANGVGSPLVDPLDRLVACPHIYLDDAGGSSFDINPVGAGTQANALVDRISVAVNWARTYNTANGKNVKVYLGEIGFYGGATNAGLGGNYSLATAQACWANFITYLNANRDVLLGFGWWGASEIGWWDDTGTTHFSITPTTAGATYSGDTVNMDLIETSFAAP